MINSNKLNNILKNNSKETYTLSDIEFKSPNLNIIKV